MDNELFFFGPLVVGQATGLHYYPNSDTFILNPSGNNSRASFYILFIIPDLTLNMEAA